MKIVNMFIISHLMLPPNIDLRIEKAYVSKQVCKYGRCQVCELPCKLEPLKLQVLFCELNI